ncbi:MAG: hypothetical protein NVS9B13_02210 [Candidatus Acidiferrum sp.]
MNHAIPKYVTQARAAFLLGIPAEELNKISMECGLGHKEQSGKEVELFFTYEELRKICMLAVHHAEVAQH